MLRLLILTSVLTACGSDGGTDGGQTTTPAVVTGPEQPTTHTPVIIETPMPTQPVDETPPPPLNGETNEQYAARMQEWIDGLNTGIADFTNAFTGVANGSSIAPFRDDFDSIDNRWKNPLKAFDPEAADSTTDVVKTDVEETVTSTKCGTGTVVVGHVTSSTTFTNGRTGQVYSWKLEYRLIRRQVGSSFYADYLEAQWKGLDGVKHTHTSASPCGAGVQVLQGTLDPNF